MRRLRAKGAVVKSWRSNPDVSDILKRKAEGRRDIARRSLGEKIAKMESLRERLAPFKHAREQLRAAKPPRSRRCDLTISSVPVVPGRPCEIGPRHYAQEAFERAEKRMAPGRGASACFRRRCGLR